MCGIREEKGIKSNKKLQNMSNFTTNRLPNCFFVALDGDLLVTP